MPTGKHRRFRERRLHRLRSGAVSMGVAILMAVVVSTGGWAAFSTLQRASPAELTAARALAAIDKFQLVASVIHLHGRTLRGECLSGSFAAFGKQPAERGSLLALSDGVLLLDTGLGPYSLTGRPQPANVLDAEWILAGCPYSLGRTIGKRLGLRLPMHVQRVRRGEEQLLRVPLLVGSRTTAYFFAPVTGAPRRMEYAGSGLSGWSELQAAHVRHAEVHKLTMLLHTALATMSTH
ncbi:MAG: hypothetical protein ACYDA3_09615 [Gaiellaceae bacterium]